MIDVINLCRLYKESKIIEMKWIHKYYNLVNSIIKTKILLVLKILININEININIIKNVK